MGPYDKGESTVSGDDVFDGDPSSGNEKEEFNPYASSTVGAGAYVAPMAIVTQSNDNATFSLALGIATWLCHITAPFLCFTGCLAPITMIAGIVLGHLGIRDANNLNGLRRNEAIIGLVLNYLSLVGYALLIVGGGALLAGVGSGLT